MLLSDTCKCYGLFPTQQILGFQQIYFLLKQASFPAFQAQHNSACMLYLENNSTNTTYFHLCATISFITKDIYRRIPLV